MAKTPIEELLDVMNALLAPDGCPWDREQTHTSLKRYLVEESYEVLEAIDEADMHKLREELGDLLLQVVFHAALAERANQFDFNQVADTVRLKMIHRHPHVFGNLEISTSDQVMDHWEGFKRKEGKKSILEGIPKSMPALLRSYKLQEKAARVGFDWPTVDGAVDKLKEEISEFLQAAEGGTSEERTEEMGDILFAVTNIARMSGIEPEDALQRSNDKFVRRFNYIEEKIRQEGELLEKAGLEKLDRYWDEAKTHGL